MATRFLYGFTMLFAIAGVFAIDHFANETFGLFFLSTVAVTVGIFEIDRLLKFRGLPFDRNLMILLNLVTMTYVQFVASPPALVAVLTSGAGEAMRPGLHVQGEDGEGRLL